MRTRVLQLTWLVLIISLVFSTVFGIYLLTRITDPARMLRRAMRDASRSDSEEFVAELDEILRLHPDHMETLLERASCSSSAEESLGYLALIQEGRPEKVAKIRLREGNLLLKLHRGREAEAAFRQAIVLSPQLEEPRQRILPMFAMQRRPEAVREQLQALRSIRKLTLSEMIWFIAADERLTPSEDAIPILESFLRADANDQASLRGLCVYLSEEARVEEAIQKLRTELERNAYDCETVALLGQVLLTTGRADEASELLRNFALSRESLVQQWETLAQQSLSVGDLKRGRIAAEFAACTSPFKRTAAYLYFRILNELGDRQEAEIWRTRVDLLNSLHIEVHSVANLLSSPIADPGPVIRVAELLLRLDRPQEAQQWIQEAQSIGGANKRTRELERECSEQFAVHRPLTLNPPLDAWNSTQPESTVHPSRKDNSAVAADSAGIQLTDRAMQTGLIMNYENGHTGFKYLIETMGAGVGVIDFDNDGWPDLYCPQGGSLGDGPRLAPFPDQLFRNHGGIQFADVTTASGIREYGYSQGLAVGDMNHDGYDDIVVANVGRNTMLLNCGDGTFFDATEDSGIQNSRAMSASAAMADLDNDGDLDLYVVNYVDGLKVCRDSRQQITTCIPWTQDGATDELYENLGNGSFRDVTQSSQIGASRGKGLGIVVAQLDDDLQPDVFVTNDTTPNFLFHNQSDKYGLMFAELGFQAGVAVNGQGQAQAGMGIACADVDHDLRLDLYVTNFYREANTLLLQTSPGMFHDGTAAAGLREPTLPRLGFGTQAVDLDLDGWAELFVANGHIDDQLESGVEWKMAPQLFRTIDGRQWSEVSVDCGEFMLQKALGRGVATLDANRDGKPDLAVGFQDRPMALLCNETREVGHAIVVRLIGISCNRSAINAMVRWTAGGNKRITEIQGGNGYYCSNDRNLILSLGTATRAELLQVLWPDGTVDEFRNVAADRQYIIRQRMPLIEAGLQ